MTFTEYIKTITVAKVFYDTQEGIVINLYKAAGTNKKIGIETAKKWISRNSPGSALVYFNNKIDGLGFIEYFKNNTHSAWRKLQNTFKSLEDKGCVDCCTDDITIFYYSLLKQFLMFHGLQDDIESYAPPLSEIIAMTDCQNNIPLNAELIIESELSSEEKKWEIIFYIEINNELSDISLPIDIPFPYSTDNKKILNEYIMEELENLFLYEHDNIIDISLQKITKQKNQKGRNHQRCQK